MDTWFHSASHLCGLAIVESLAGQTRVEAAPATEIDVNKDMIEGDECSDTLHNTYCTLNVRPNADGKWWKSHHSESNEIRNEISQARTYGAFTLGTLCSIIVLRSKRRRAVTRPKIRVINYVSSSSATRREKGKGKKEKGESKNKCWNVYSNSRI